MKNDLGKSLIDKFKFLFNSEEKRIVFMGILFFGLLGNYDLQILLCEMPEYNQLNISVGQIKINPPIARTGRVFHLIINDKEVSFSCAYVHDDLTCLSDEMTRLYQGKIGKVWWCSKNCNRYWRYSRRLYQLEVDGKLVISYKNQIENYTKNKQSYFPSFFAAFILIVYFFIKLQFKQKTR